MVQYVSTMGKISFEEESTYGTDPATTRDFLGILTSFSHNINKNPQPIRGIGSRNIRQLSHLGTDVELTMEIQVQNIHWLYMFLGGGSLASPSEADSLPSFTFEATLDSTTDISNVYTGTVITSISLAVSEDDLITVSMSARAQDAFVYDAAQVSHASVDTDAVAAFYNATLFSKGIIGTIATSEDNDEYVGTGDGTTASFYSNHVPKSSPTPEIWVDGTAQGVTLGTIEDPEDADITTGKCYWNTSTGEITFKSTEIPSADEIITCAYEFDYEEISAKTKSITLDMNNNNEPTRGIGTEDIRQLPPKGRDYTGSCSFYKQDADQVNWVTKFQNDLTLKLVLVIAGTTYNLVLDDVGFGTHAEAWSEADIIMEDMSFTGTSLSVS